MTTTLALWWHVIGPDPGAWSDYLRDESRRQGCAQAVALPATEEEVRAALVEAAAQNWPVTIQGARTGISGGATPNGGLALSLLGLNRITGLAATANGFELTCQPGVALGDLRHCLATLEFPALADWSPAAREALNALRAAPPHMLGSDLTETSASLGGMVANNASGARSLRYGAMRRHVHGLRVLLPDGDALTLRRGREKARGLDFSLVTAGGRTLAGRLPTYRQPTTKNAAGYYAAPDMDLIDLWIGAEGTLGVVTEITLGLVPAPPHVWGLMVFLPAEQAALDLVRRLRAADATGPGTVLSALEYLDARALELLRQIRQAGRGPADLPALPPAFHTGLFIEYEGTDEAVLEAQAERVMRWAGAAGGTEDAIWLAADARERERLRAFRHAVPEAVNALIDERRRTVPGLTKLGTDMAVPDGALDAVMTLYREGLARAGLEYVIFGHVGNNHVHVNIIPRSRNEYETGQALYLEWARQVVAWGGTISAEHGIGKLKTAFLPLMYSAADLEAMRALKRCFDPDGRLNPGNLFAAEAAP